MWGTATGGVSGGPITGAVRNPNTNRYLFSHFTIPPLAAAFLLTASAPTLISLNMMPLAMESLRISSWIYRLNRVSQSNGGNGCDPPRGYHGERMSRVPGYFC